MARGIVVAVSTETIPPDITGFYNEPDGSGLTLATSNGVVVNGRIVGFEIRTVVQNDGTANIDSVSYTSLNPIGFTLGSGTIIRGSGDAYTLYSRSRRKCSENGSDFDTLGVSVRSAVLENGTGDIIEQTELYVTVDTVGTSTQSCAIRATGETEIIGGWAVTANERVSRVEPTDFIYMCVDDAEAYVPTESWIRDNGESCQCTLNYSIECT